MIESIRVLIALAAIKQLEWIQFDVTTAFLNGDIEENIFVEAPKGIKIQTDECLQLKKALYGLKQAPRAWSSKFNTALLKLGFVPTLSDPCVYPNQEQNMYLGTYVDDGIVLGDTKQKCLEFVARLNNEFKTNIVEGSIFLGIEINRKMGAIEMRQGRYILDTLERFNQQDSKPVSAPCIDFKSLMAPDDSKTVDAPYREAVGSLLYLALNTRPDILFVTIQLSRFNSAPKEKHWRAVQ